MAGMLVAVVMMTIRVMSFAKMATAVMVVAGTEVASATHQIFGTFSHDRNDQHNQTDQNDQSDDEYRKDSRHASSAPFRHVNSLISTIQFGRKFQFTLSNIFGRACNRSAFPGDA